jgi:hypothetical protein
MSDLEARLRRVEDIIEIGQLRARYCALLDAFDWDALAELFTPDGEFHGIGAAYGRDELKQFYAKVRDESGFDAWWHFSSNETVEVDGDVATGETYLDQPSVINGKAYACAGRYRDNFARVDGRWLFSKRQVSFFYFVPLDEGWAPGRIVPPDARQAAD